MRAVHVIFVSILLFSCGNKTATKDKSQSGKRLMNNLRKPAGTVNSIIITTSIISLMILQVILKMDKQPGAVLLI